MIAISGTKLGILRGNGSAHRFYVDACDELGVDHTVVDLLASNWLAQVRSSGCAGFLARPPANYLEVNDLYMERLYLLTRVMGESVYPTFDELFLYENKCAVYDWLAVHGYPHLPTFVSADRQETLDYLSSASYPQVVKSRIGHGSKSVTVVRSAAAGRRLADRIFGSRSPALARGHANWRWKGMIPFLPRGASQRHYVILQPFVPIRWEWRIIRIGDSYFGHRKLLRGDFASGTMRKGWVEPPEPLLLLIREICDRSGFLSMAMDVFETEDGEFRINELQSLFGSAHESQMYLDGVPGRFVFEDGAFRFEEGVFNRHRSYGLRVRHFLELLGRWTELAGSVP